MRKRLSDIAFAMAIVAIPLAFFLIIPVVGMVVGREYGSHPCYISKVGGVHWECPFLEKGEKR